MKAVCKLMSYIMMLTFLLSPLAFAPSTSAQTQSAPAPAAGVSLTPTWVTQAEPFVHVTSRGARIDPKIYNHLKPEVVRLVQQAVRQYNAIPMLQREQGSTFQATPSASLQFTSAAGCKGQERITLSYQWWGIRYHLNSCAVQTIAAAGGGAAAIAGIIAAVCTPCAPVAGIIAGVLAIYTGWIVWADIQCGGAGVYVNVSYVGTPPWVSRVC